MFTTTVQSNEKSEAEHYQYNDSANKVYHNKSEQ